MIPLVGSAAVANSVKRGKNAQREKGGTGAHARAPGESSLFQCD